MFTRVIRHLRHQPVAIVALFFALGGGALAASNYIRPTDTIPAGDLAGSTYGDPLIAAGKVTNSKLANSSLSITAGTGLTGGGSVALGGTGGLSVDPTVVQLRATGTCASGGAISSINQDGTVGCRSSLTQMMGGSGTSSVPGGTEASLAGEGISSPTSPFAAGVGSSAMSSTASHLYVNITTPPGAGMFWRFDLTTGAGVNVHCLISNSDKHCSNTSDTIPIPQGSTVYLTTDPVGIGAGPGATVPPDTQVTFGWVDATP